MGTGTHRKLNNPIIADRVKYYRFKCNKKVLVY